MIMSEGGEGCEKERMRESMYVSKYYLERERESMYVSKNYLEREREREHVCK